MFLTYVLSVTELYSYRWLKWYVIHYMNLSQLKMNKSQKQINKKQSRKEILFSQCPKHIFNLVHQEINKDIKNFVIIAAFLINSKIYK